jgi:hypothetical protein
MPFSAGTYTPPVGAENATAGKTIASATWNSIFTDLSSALTTVGSAPANSLAGNNTNTTATITYLTTSLINAMIQPQNLVSVMTQANLAVVANTDIAVSIILPSGTSNYLVSSLRLANASSPMTSGAVALFTAAAGGGVQIMVSTDVSITVAVSASGNTQTINTTNPTSQATNVTTLYVRVMASCSANADLLINIVPMY